jgi:predicted ATPase
VLVILWLPKKSFQQAMIVARRQSAKFWELRAATSLARRWRDQGMSGEARDLLVRVYEWFTEGNDTPVLRQAKALLNTLASLLSGRCVITSA